MIHIIQGNGKGKTTASVGLAVRAAGHDLKVLFIQFLKDDSSGEIRILKNIPVPIVVTLFGIVTSFRLEQPEKALSSIVVTLFEIIADSIPVQP